MHEMDLAAKRRRNKPIGTRRRKGALVAPNLLNREFSAAAPNTKWVSDTTYVWTAEGWLYVAVILDLFSRLVVGWAMGESNDEDLVRSALEMAQPIGYLQQKCSCTPIKVAPIRPPTI